jgi:hypothetical protein
MSKHNLIKRTIAGGLVIAAAGFPTAAQAMVDAGAGGGSGTPITSVPAASQPLASSDSSFQWGDAAIGAAGAVVLMSGGVLGAGVTRRRGQRTVVG